MPKITRVAIDTNVVLNFAALDEVVIDCFDIIKKRLENVKIIILPTVILELTDIAGDDSDEARPLAEKSLSSIVEPWKFTPVNCVPVGHGIVEQIGNRIRAKALLPDEEIHDSFLIAEAALYGATLLLSSDGHIKNIDQQMLRIELKSCDVDCPLIASPWKIVNQFFR